MTTEKLVMNSLFGKTELASVKIDLGLIDDIQKNIDNGTKLLTDSITKGGLAENTLKEQQWMLKMVLKKQNF